MAIESKVKIYGARHLISVEGASISPGALAVRDGKILSVGDPHQLLNEFPGAEYEEFAGKTLIPGLVNAHTDLSLSRLDPAKEKTFMAPDGTIPLMRWLIILSRYKNLLSIPDQQKAIGEGLDQMKRSGVTTLGDKCRYPAGIPLYEKSGLRVVAMTEIENIQRRMAQEDFEQALAMVDEIQHSENNRISAGLAPFSAYTLSKNLLRIVADHAVGQGIPLHLHGAMSFSEMEFFYDSLGEITAVLFLEAGWKDKIPPPHRMTPIQYLHEIGVLRAKPAIIGCLHLGPTDTALLENQKCRRIYSPISFQYLQLGDIPWNKVIAKKVPWSFGTLGRAWGSTGNLWDEMRAVLYEAPEDLRSLWAVEIFRAATLGGAEALSLQEEVGSLVPGKKADFIVVDTPSGEDSLEASLIEQTQARHLQASFVAGDCLFRA